MDAKLHINVLVVRSQPTSHRSLKGFLTKSGFTVVETTNGHDTMAALPSVESIVIDLLMEHPTVDDIKVINVLVVRSQPTSHRSLKGFLTKSGFTVVETTNGHDTMAALPSVESIVIDLLMEHPTVDDIKVIKKIRDSGCLIPIVIVGQVDSPVIQEEVERYELVQYLSKPTDYLLIEKEIMEGAEAHRNIKELESLTEGALESIESFVKWTGEMAMKDKLAGACM